MQYGRKWEMSNQLNNKNRIRLINEVRIENGTNVTIKQKRGEQEIRRRETNK